MWICNDALEALRSFPDNSVDFVFTDPTYGGSIQYGELCYFWLVWLGYGEDYLRSIMLDEVVINEQQGKRFNDYYRMLYTIFKEVGRVLKPNKYMIVTFHNPEFRIRNALERAAYIAGFDLENIIYQPPPKIPGKKTSMQPYGSISGDFYFRFRNAKKPDRRLNIDDTAFERIIVQTTKHILVERGQPTPMPIISNGIEPALCQHGFPIPRDPERRSVETVILDHVGREFIVIDPKTGRVIQRPKKILDKLIWLKEPERYLINRIPLDERVERMVVAILLRKRKVTFTEVMSELYTTFKNALTPDRPSVKAILEAYAEPRKKLWVLKRSVEMRESEHNKIIGMLAEIGKKIGYRVWIGLREQAAEYKGAPLRTLCDFHEGSGPTGITDDKWNNYVRHIDVLWIDQGRIVCAFEVENTTAITEGINRCSNIPTSIRLKSLL